MKRPARRGPRRRSASVAPPSPAAYLEAVAVAEAEIRRVLDGPRIRLRPPAPPDLDALAQVVASLRPGEGLTAEDLDSLRAGLREATRPPRPARRGRQPATTERAAARAALRALVEMDSPLRTYRDEFAPHSHSLCDVIAEGMRRAGAKTLVTACAAQTFVKAEVRRSRQMAARMAERLEAVLRRHEPAIRALQATLERLREAEERAKREGKRDT